MNAIEQKLLNVANTIVDAAAHLVAAKNPAYASLIGLGTSLVDNINAQVNPTAPAAAQTISQTAASIAGAAAPTVAAISTVTSGSANATQKASAISTVVATAESIGADILKLI